ncbi:MULTISPECIES: ribosome-inactivating family protein [Burkholderiaceae]|uniref:ribosome-inactivating family protein n=1 Tax=Burkholderiaceae TaxID=119060 RepID=UPI00095E9183|nr:MULTISPECIES: ribosome-inactivating family protein [Burkholderiaceae]MCG1019339.1 ribosome-inactivating family protein [Mycetohabitans sp. B4]SIT66977.1 Ribosome inactivating protein [Burkholderia sp. b13]
MFDLMVFADCFIYRQYFGPYFSGKLILEGVVVNKFDFRFDDGNQYYCSIEELIKKASDDIGHIPGIRATKKYSNDVWLINFPGVEKANGLSLAMWERNLYIVGFVLDKKFYRFSDDEFKGISVEGAEISDLGVKSNYQDLRNIAGKDGGDTIQISQKSIEDAAISLKKFSGKFDEKLAKSIIVLAAAIPEAMRMRSVFYGIKNAINKGESFALDDKVMGTIKNWSKFSKYVKGINDFFKNLEQSGCDVDKEVFEVGEKVKQTRAQIATRLRGYSPRLAIVHR